MRFFNCFCRKITIDVTIPSLISGQRQLFAAFIASYFTGPHPKKYSLTPAQHAQAPRPGPRFSPVERSKNNLPAVPLPNIGLPALQYSPAKVHGVGGLDFQGSQQTAHLSLPNARRAWPVHRLHFPKIGAAAAFKQHAFTAGLYQCVNLLARHRPRLDLQHGTGADKTLERHF